MIAISQVDVAFLIVVDHAGLQLDQCFIFCKFNEFVGLFTLIVFMMIIIILLLHLLLIFEAARIHEKLFTLMVLNEKVIVKTLLLRV